MIRSPLSCGIGVHRPAFVRHVSRKIGAGHAGRDTAVRHAERFDSNCAPDVHGGIQSVGKSLRDGVKWRRNFCRRVTFLTV
jgi:hypothetical protein